MKYLIASIAAAFALSLSVQAAEVSTKLTDVHLCCQSCVKGVAKAVEKIPAVTATADMDEGTVSLTGPDAATVQKAADALVAAGYFGKSSNPDIKVATDTGAKGEKVQSLKVEDVHLCCGKCVKAVNTALESVPGVKANIEVVERRCVFVVDGNASLFGRLQLGDGWGLRARVSPPDLPRPRPRPRAP